MKKIEITKIKENEITFIICFLKFLTHKIQFKNK